MKRLQIIGISFGVFLMMVLLAGGSVFGGTDVANSLPEVEFLGEGPETFNTTLDDFIVKRGQEQYDFVAGPAYEAAAGERVWAVRGTKEAPNVINNSVDHLGTAYKNCTVEYVGIDDDENGIRNGFFLGPNLVELIQEGMVFQGDYIVPITSQDHRLVAEESIAYWFTPCEEEEPTATPTSTKETTETPPPGDEAIVFLPAIFDTGDEPPPPTETPSAPTATPEGPTETPIPPTETPTATVEPDTYTLVCNPDFNINIVDEEAHFRFSATAYENGFPLENVELRGVMDTGFSNPHPANVETTNVVGVADFFITILWLNIEQTPVATVTFNDQATYGNATCNIDFSIELQTPTPTPPPAPDGFDLTCLPEYDITIRDVDVEFKFAANAWYNGFPLPDVNLEAKLDAGGEIKDTVAETNADGVANFTILLLFKDIKKTPIATITFDDQDEYGDVFCQIDFSESDALLTSILNRSS